MPQAQIPPERDPFRFDRFRPAIHRVETPNYNQRTGELRDDLLRRREQSVFLTIKYGLSETGTRTEQSLPALIQSGHPGRSWRISPAL
jgi:hypothetical protein